jgi:3-oxoacyl-[acyl-carrier protein] reductase
VTSSSSLKGRRCIVTGASRGLGAAIARRFWEEGANLLLVARSGETLGRLVDELGSRPGQRAHALACDLADPAAGEAIVAAAREALGGVSILVNNAAIQGPIGVAWENDPAEWEEAIRINLLAPVDLCRRVVPLMAAAGAGKIINLSGGGATGPRPRFTAYAAAKAGLVRFSETLAHETRAIGIDVNSVAPGAMSSAMTEAVLAAGPNRAGDREHAEAARLTRVGTPAIERAAALCAFLASAAGDGITGKLISAVWDPWETLAAHRDDLDRTDIYTLRRIVPADRNLAWGSDQGQTGVRPGSDQGQTGVRPGSDQGQSQGQSRGMK